MELTEFPTMCADMFRAPVTEHIANTFKVDFAEDLSVGRPVKIDILIGLGNKLHEVCYVSGSSKDSSREDAVR